jgi:hypothetical protein
MPRFSLNWLLAAIAFFGLVVAVLHRPESYLTLTLALIVWGSLVSAAMFVILSGVRRHTFALGFFFVGLAFFLTCAIPAGWSPLADIRAGLNSMAIPVHDAIVPILAQRLAEPGESISRQDNFFVYSTSGNMYEKHQELDHTRNTVQLTVGMLISCLGGCFASWLKSRDDQRRSLHGDSLADLHQQVV